jgi:hypothetical protein
MLIGLVVAATFAPEAAQLWTEALPDGPVATALTGAASGWDEALSAVGASRPRAWLRHAVRVFETMRF